MKAFSSSSSWSSTASEINETLLSSSERHSRALARVLLCLYHIATVPTAVPTKKAPEEPNVATVVLTLLSSSRRLSSRRHYYYSPQQQGSDERSAGSSLVSRGSSAFPQSDRRIQHHIDIVLPNMHIPLHLFKH